MCIYIHTHKPSSYYFSNKNRSIIMSFTSSKNNNRFTYDIYLAEMIKNLWKKNDDDDNNTTTKHKLSKFPLSLQPYIMKNRRLRIENELKEKLNNLYNEGHPILEMKRSLYNLNSMQSKYAFTDEFSKTIIKGVEVNCRMVTTNLVNNQSGPGVGINSSSSSSFSSSSYNLMRIGNITFKGNFKTVIDELMEKCKKELQEKFHHKITEIKSAAMYVPEHNGNLCGWDCVKLEKNIKKNSEYSKFFNSLAATEENDYRHKPLCYYKRQLIGQEIVPFADINDDDDENKDNNNNEELISCKQNEFIFDHLFFDKNELCGIKKHPIRYTPNFLNTVDRDECSALLSFSLDYIGVTSDRMNLYLKPLPGDNPIYCTNVSSSNNFYTASKFLNEQLFTNINVVNILKNEYKIKIPKYIEDYHDKQKDAVVEEEEDDDDDDEKEEKMKKKKNNNNKRKFKSSNNTDKKFKKYNRSSDSSSSNSCSSSSGSDDDDDDDNDKENKYTKDIDKALKSIA